MARSTRATTGRPARSVTRRSIRTGRSATAATMAASRHSPGRTGSLPRVERRPRRRPSSGHGMATRTRAQGRAGSAAEGLRRVGRYLGIGTANMIVVISPDRVVIGGGIAAAGDLLLESAREEIGRRVRTTGHEEVAIVTAELGTWAGAIGAAVPGAEAA